MSDELANICGFAAGSAVRLRLTGGYDKCISCGYAARLSLGETLQ